MNSVLQRMIGSCVLADDVENIENRNSSRDGAAHRSSGHSGALGKNPPPNTPKSAHSMPRSVAWTDASSTPPAHDRSLYVADCSLHSLS